MKLVNWCDWDHLLGLMPDTELATRIGCSKTSVLKRRKIKMIPAHTVLQNEKPKTHIKFVFDDHTIKLFLDEADLIGLDKQTMFRIMIHHWLKSKEDVR